MNSGPVTAGVLRGTKSRFQLFGDTVNTASRMESCGEPGRIHLSASTTYYLQEDETPHRVVPRTTRITPKGKGTMDTYWLLPFDSEDVGNANDIGVEHHGTKSRIQGRT